MLALLIAINPLPQCYLCSDSIFRIFESFRYCCIVVERLRCTEAVGEEETFHIDSHVDSSRGISGNKLGKVTILGQLKLTSCRS